MAQDRRRRGASRPQRPNLALVAFDFDGTLTTKDSYTAFLRWRAGLARYALGMAKLAPAGLRYLSDHDRGHIKAAATAEFLKGLPREEVEAAAQAFAELYAPRLLRPDALATWRRWRAEGARLVIVSASPSVVVRPFAERLDADELIATELAYDRWGRITGSFLTPNCRGPEKVARLKAAFGRSVKLKAAYGDTSGDREMLELAEIRGYKVFKEKP